MKDERLYLIHIWECIQRIEFYTGEDKASFLASAMMQDVLIHNYMGVDLEEVWNILENELPQIKNSLKAILVELQILP